MHKDVYRTLGSVAAMAGGLSFVGDMLSKVNGDERAWVQHSRPRRRGTPKNRWVAWGFSATPEKPRKQTDAYKRIRRAMERASRKVNRATSRR